MECPNCKVSILDHAKVCPFCQTRFDNKTDDDIKELKESIKASSKDKSKKRGFRNFKKKKKSYKDRKTDRDTKETKKEFDENKFNKLFTSDDFDISYTINSAEETQLIRDAINGGSLKSGEPRANVKKAVKKKKRISNKVRRYIFFSIVSILLCLLLFWGCSAVYNAINSKHPVSAFMYLKNNTLSVNIDKISMTLSDNLIDLESYKSSDTSGNNTELTADKIIEIYNSNNLVSRSDNERYIYFISNFNTSTNLGQLKCLDIKKKKIIDIAENVSDSFVISKDGKSVLFLRNTDYSGNAGELCFKETGSKSVINISGDIDKNMYAFSQDESKALFLGNFNYSLEAGDLYEYDLTAKNAERIKVDTDVCRVFGTDKSGKIYIYAKDYNASLGYFDIYQKEQDKERKKLVEQSALSPIISENSNEMYMYGGIENNTHNIYIVNILSGEKQKIASGITDIVKISEDEKTILYRKVYNEQTSDYYIYSRKSNEPSKVASDVRIIPSDSKFSGISQLSISEDFSCISYISGFDIEKGKGVLYKTRYVNNTAKESEKIADEVFLCHTSLNGKRIIYAKNYSLTRDVVDVYSNTGAENVCLKEEIEFNLFEISETGDNIICISGYNTVGEYGTLEIINSKADSSKISDDVSAFYVLNNSEVFMLKNYDGQAKTFDIFKTDKKGNTIKTDSGATYIIG